MASDRAPRNIGLAIVGAGRIGLIRGEIAARHPSVGWIGIAETRADRGKQVAERLGADFVTTDFRELLGRSEARLQGRLRGSLRDETWGRSRHSHVAELERGSGDTTR